MLSLYQNIGQEEFVSDLTGYNKIMNPDQKGDEEMDEGNFYRRDTKVVYGFQDQEYAEKAETDYDEFL